MSECGYGCSQDIAGNVISHIDCPRHGAQAHAMSHPTAQADGVQHISDAAWGVMRKYGGNRGITEQACMQDGVMMRTVAEWQSLQAERDFAVGIVDAMLREQVRLRGEIAQMRKQRAKSKEVMPNAVRLENDPRSAAHAVTGGAHRHNALTFLPEPDNRLGRGNAAMDAT